MPDIDLSSRSMSVNASLVKRLAAFMIDLFLVNLIVAIPFRGLLRGFDGFSSAFAYLLEGGSRASLLAAIGITTSLLTLLYFVWLEATIGQTVGKMILNLNVASANDGSLWRYLLRSIFLIPATPFMVLWIADIAYLFFSQDSQRLTELLSGTRVIEKIGW